MGSGSKDQVLCPTNSWSGSFNPQQSNTDARSVLGSVHGICTRFYAVIKPHRGVIWDSSYMVCTPVSLYLQQNPERCCWCCAGASDKTLASHSFSSLIVVENKFVLMRKDFLEPREGKQTAPASRHVERHFYPTGTHARSRRYMRGDGRACVRKQYKKQKLIRTNKARLSEHTHTHTRVGTINLFRLVACFNYYNQPPIIAGARL